MRMPFASTSPDCQPAMPVLLLLQLACVDEGVRGDHAPVPGRAVFGNARLRGIVDIDNAEALAVSVGPLEVIHQRPEEVAAYWGAIRDRLAHCADVTVQVGDPPRVVDPAANHLVVEGDAILGDVDRFGRVVAVQ